MLITPSFKKSLIVEEFQGNYVNFLFYIRITDKWNDLPKEIAEAENFNIFKNRLRRHLIDFSSKHTVL